MKGDGPRSPGSSLYQEQGLGLQWNEIKDQFFTTRDGSDQSIETFSMCRCIPVSCRTTKRLNLLYDDGDDTSGPYLQKTRTDRRLRRDDGDGRGLVRGSRVRSRVSNEIRRENKPRSLYI